MVRLTQSPALEAHVPGSQRGRLLLTPAQHHEIRAWISAARTPEAIMQMPAGLWRSLELASVLMAVDADLTQPPCFDGAG